MRLDQVLCGPAVTAGELSLARNALARKRQELLKTEGAASLVCFSLNIAGPVKTFPLARRAFDAGVSEIRNRLKTDGPGCPPLSGTLLHFEEAADASGQSAFFLLSARPEPVKEQMAAIEESHPLGRLFDIGVWGTDGAPRSRRMLGLPARSCLVCGEAAALCAAKKTHSTELLQWRTVQILNEYFRGRAADTAAACAVRALLYEVSSTPKPGLVDRSNSGSHRDMDFFTFLDSSAALIPWFRDFFCLGWDHADEPDPQLFSRLRFAGQKAEERMFAATGGVNTHKGLIFSSAILCAALGKLHAESEAPLDSRQVIAVCRRLGSCSLKDFGPTAGSAPIASPETAGEKCHRAYGLLGGRGEAAAGFPAALEVGLPALRLRLSEGFSLNDAAVLALLSMIAVVDDTNMIHRGGRKQAEKSKKEAASLLSSITGSNFREALTALDQDYIRLNLSPGGCADLLAVSLMLYFLESSGMTTLF